MSRFVVRQEVPSLPRVPLLGTLDLTYRCANDCRHCWLRIPPTRKRRPPSSRRRDPPIVDEARAMAAGSGRSRAASPCSVRTSRDLRAHHGELVPVHAEHERDPDHAADRPAPEAKGTTLVALYGATSGVHDAVTRRPGSFEALCRGVAYLKEAGAAFTVQVIPLKTNSGEYEAMIELARSGAPAGGSARRGFTSPRPAIPRRTPRSPRRGSIRPASWPSPGRGREPRFPRRSRVDGLSVPGPAGLTPPASPAAAISTSTRTAG